ncbi:hypothetical protein CERSUDRAFT_95309 [Gelatoporia subvermispora B]|uniref:UPF3 domain-containing protein n=1 Tax=Ceriporiopsis subvermispora (strain B) TaxID=914234 RepID=M2QY23_CERS8|nr:hypothetical protein CERSUDRAFT_95309 [Gelatoporia subvermispora B]
MAPPDPIKSSGASSSKPKPKEREKDKKAKAAAKPQNDRFKTVVRRLPPNLPEEIFWQSVQKWVTEETIQWKIYYQGKFKTRMNKENIQSRAYIAFKNEEILATFSREYDGHLFRDKAGNESSAVVEFAPFQKIPSEKKKVDSRMGTIEKDEDYISFLESLNNPASKPADADTLETLITSTQPPPHPTTTPLLEALKAEKSAQKDKEAILRNHAHYKDHQILTATAGAAKKDDSKKKGGAAPSTPVAQKPAEQPLGKKAAKKAAAAAKAAQQQQAQASSSSTPAPAKSSAAPAAQGKQPSNAPPTPKAPRPPRERPPKPSPVLGIPAEPSADPSSSSAQPTTVPTPTAPRRGRPVIGIASRTFEAALSGAGVERKSRREREKDHAAASPADSPSAPATPSEASAGKGKAKEERRLGGVATSGNVALGVQQQRAQPPGGATTILQRDQPPKILPRQQAHEGGAGGDTMHMHEEAPPVGGGGRGGGRGRGRGRGRGGRGAPAGS